MAVKEELRALIDRLDDEQASVMMLVATRLANNERIRPAELEKMGIDVDAETIMLLSRPVTNDDPFWGAPPLIDDGPTDMSSNKHKYLAEIYGDLHEE
jgi:hypothetical protein